MKCQQCGRPALVGIGERGEVHLCLDCYAKFAAIADRQIENSERMMNYLAAEMEATVGLPGLMPRFPERRPPTIVQSENVVMHNIQIDRSNIGVLNTGHIGAVDTAIGAMRTGGDANAAEAFRALTEQIARLENADAAQKNHLLEILSVLASEASLPKPQRRSAAMRPLLVELATLSSGLAGLAQLYSQYAPVITALFQ